MEEPQGARKAQVRMPKGNAALIGKSGELLVAAELMRRGVEVAHPASDVGVDLLAYRLHPGSRTTRRFVPIQVKAYSGTGYRFLKNWFDRAADLALVQVWHLATTPQFYVFRDLGDVEDAIAGHTHTPSWTTRGVWSATAPSGPDMTAMAPHLGRWDRIVDQIEAGPARATGHISDVFGILKREGQPSLSIDEINEAIADGWAGIR